MDKEYANPQVSPKSTIGKALAYSLRHLSQPSAYVQNGEWQIDNKAVENKIRPLAK